MTKILVLTLGLVLFPGIAAGADATPPADQSPITNGNSQMTITQSIVLGIVEGLTEYLPVSSTGHLLVTQKLMGIGEDSEQSKQAADAYAICIQAGAIVAVLGLYFRRVKQVFPRHCRQRPDRPAHARQPDGGLCAGGGDRVGGQRSDQTVSLWHVAGGGRVVLWAGC
jgi:hypothetical protein